MKSYFITSQNYYKSLNDFEELLEKVYKNHKIDFSCFRDKNNQNIQEYAKLFLKITKKYNIKALINSHINLAINLNFDGIHLTSNQFNLIELAKINNLYTIISTHSIDEAKKAKILGADAVTFSPIFNSPNKGRPKGIKNLKEFLNEIEIDCFALGGIISQKHIDLCKNTNCYGFASIRYFIK